MEHGLRREDKMQRSLLLFSYTYRTCGCGNACGIITCTKEQNTTVLAPLPATGSGVAIFILSLPFAGTVFDTLAL